MRGFKIGNGGGGGCDDACGRRFHAGEHVGGMEGPWRFGLLLHSQGGWIYFYGIYISILYHS